MALCNLGAVLGDPLALGGADRNDVAARVRAVELDDTDELARQTLICLDDGVDLIDKPIVEFTKRLMLGIRTRTLRTPVSKVCRVASGERPRDKLLNHFFTPQSARQVLLCARTWRLVPDVSRRDGWMMLNAEHDTSGTS